MDDRERAELSRRLRKALKLIYLTSLGAAYIYRGHGRRTVNDALRDQLAAYALEQQARRDEAAALLAAMGSGLPLQRPLWHIMGWAWGLLTSLTSPTFRLHMLANIEHEGQKITRAADTLARELVDFQAASALARVAKAENARKEWLVERLREAAQNS